MKAKIKLDYSIEAVQKYGDGALITSAWLYHNYSMAKRCGAVSIEGYVEWWLKKNIEPRIEEFDDLVLNIFLQILGSQELG